MPSRARDSRLDFGSCEVAARAVWDGEVCVAVVKLPNVCRIRLLLTLK